MPGVEATNGYVYVMGDVMVPALGTVVDVAVTFKDAGFGTLVDAVTAADLVDTFPATARSRSSPRSTPPSRRSTRPR